MKNINQVYTANPITSNASTDLMYFGQSPYGITDDAAELFSDFAAQFAPSSIYPSTFTPQEILYAPTSNTIGQIATGNNLVMTTDGAGNASFTYGYSSTVVGGNNFVIRDTDGNIAVNSLAVGTTSLVTSGQTVNMFLGSSQYQRSTGTANITYVLPNATTLTNGWYFNFVNASTGTMTIKTFGGTTIFTISGNSAALITLNDDSTSAGAWDAQWLGYPKSNAGYVWTNNSATSSPTWQAPGGSGTVSSGTTNQIAYYASSGTTVSGLTGANDGVLITGNTGVPSLLANSGTPGFVLTANTGAPPSWQAPGGSNPWQAGVGTGSAIDKNGSTASGNYSLAYGINNTLVGTECYAIGGGNSSTAGGALLFGLSNTSIGVNNILIGQSNSTSDADNVVFGNGNTVDIGEIVFGVNNAVSNTAYAVMGSDINSSGLGAISIGNLLTSAAAGVINIGYNTSISSSSAGYSVAIGYQHTFGAVGLSVAIGYSCTIGGADAISIGSSSTSNGTGSISIGKSCTATGNYSVAIGNTATSNNNGSFVMGDSNASPTQDTAVNQFKLTYAGGYYFYLANNPTLAVSIDTTGNLINSKGQADQSYSLQTPSTGFSITIGAGVKTLILNPSGTLATGTVIMPASPIDGQEIRVCSSQIITSLTVSPNGGQSIEGVPTTLGIGGGFAYIYNLSGTKWFRLY